MRTMRPVLAICLLLLSAAFAQADNKRVLGKLGQALKATKIHASPNTKSRVYYRVKPYEYLVIQKYSSNYHKVLLSNGIYAYVPKTAVAELPYQVTQPEAKTRNSREAGDPTSRGAISQYALNYIGTPYVWGGNDMRNGVDCSGFVKNLYGQIGVNLPRTAAEQARVGKEIRRYEDLRAGDRLYFWDAKRGKIGHTGIYLGNGNFVHSSSGKGGVSTDVLSPRWQKILVAARR